MLNRITNQKQSILNIISLRLTNKNGFYMVLVNLRKEVNGVFFMRF